MAMLFTPLQAAIRYVKPVASGLGDGSSWGNASSDLQAMINASASGDQVWVAAGTYKPTTGTNRSISFVMKNGVAIYGGFIGSETLLSQRDWMGNATVLSGDLNGNDVISGSGQGLSISNRSENSLHVVNNAFTSANPLTASAILDGFTITGGNADAVGDFSGAGMYNLYASPTLNNLIFLGNWSVQLGGGMYNTLGASPTLNNVTFSRNVAQGTGAGGGGGGGGLFNFTGSLPVLNNVHFSGNLSYGSGGGGGVLNYQVSPTFNHCSFTGNYAFSGGGGASNLSSSPAYINCLFSTNGAYSYGGAVFNQFNPVVFTNCTFYGNTAIFVGGIANNSGGSSVVRNCIMWANTGSINRNIDGGATVTYSTLEGSLYQGTGNANMPPSFQNAGNPIGADGLWGTADDGLRLLACSFGINLGDNTNLPATDFAGSTRIFNNAVDMGAYELQGAHTPLTFYRDKDNDGYGNAAITALSCTAPPGYVSDNTDCNDNNPAVNPGVAESVCNSIDDDCSGTAERDNIFPTALCKDISVALVNGSASITAAQIDNGSSDNCSVSLLASPSTFDCLNLGQAVPVLLTVTDPGGNTATCTANVTVTGNCNGICAPTVLLFSAPNPSQSGTTASWTASSTGFSKVKITAKGAKGGNGNFNGRVTPGGSGAVMTGEFIVGPGQVLEAIAGAPGQDAPRYGGGGGGGGSGVKIQTQPLIIAGGGGGGGVNSGGGDGVITSGNGMGGTCGGGASGGGLLGNGCNSTTGGPFNGLGGGGGFDALGGGGPQTGGGGFGAGGGSNSAGAGGGGYSGGNGECCGVFFGRGGSSFNVGSNPNNLAGANNAGGQVIIECLGPVAFTANVTPTQPACTNPQGSLQIDLTGDNDGNTTGLEYAIVAGSSFTGSPTFSDITADPFNITSGLGTIGDADGETYTVRIRLKYNPGAYLDHSYTLTIQDNVPPIALCQDVTVQLDANGGSSVTGQQVDNGSSDACGIQSLSVSPNTFDCTQTGNNSVTLTVTDVGGNTATCNATVTVQDLIPPTVVCQDITVQLPASGSFPLSTAFILANVPTTFTDNCQINNSVIGLGAPFLPTYTCSEVGTFSATFGFKDVSLNNTDCTIDVTVEDNLAPTAVCQNLTVQLDNTGNASVSGQQVDGGSSDNCSITSWVLSQTAFTCAHTGSNPVNLTIADASGNTATCNATVTVEDNADPIAICQNVTVQLDNTGNGSTTAAAVDNGSNDACGIANLSLSQTAFTCGDLGSNPVTLTVTDQKGNTSTCSATVTVQDTAAPTALCQNLQVALVANSASITPAQIDGGSSDNCSVSLLASPTSFDCSHLGQVVPVQLTVTDPAGNSATCTANVTVTGVCEGVCPSTALFVNAPTHSQMGTVANWTVPAGGPYKVRITAKGAKGGDLQGGGHGAIMAGDFIVVSGQTLDANAGAPGSIDNNNGRSISGGGGSGVKVGNFIYVIAGGGAGGLGGFGNATTGTNGDNGVAGNNSAIGGQGGVNGNGGGGGGYLNSVSNGGGGGVFSAGQNGLNQLSTGGGAGFNAMGGSGTANGGGGFGGGGGSTGDGTGGGGGYSGGGGGGVNVGGGGGSFNLGNNQANIAGPGANNGGGEVLIECLGPAAFTADFTPTQPNCANPTQGGLRIDLTGDNDGNTIGLEYAIVAGSNFSGSPTFSDITADPFDLTSGFGTLGDADGETYTVRIRLKYNPSISLDHSYTLAFVDNTPPTAVCQNLTLFLNAAGNASITANDVDNGSSDACGIGSLSVLPNSFGCGNVGPNTVVLTVTDVNGNTATCNGTVTVIDSTAPLISCPPAISTNICDLSEAAAYPDLAAFLAAGGSASDACGINNSSLQLLSQVQLSNCPQEAYLRTYQVADVNGNSSRCTQRIDVSACAGVGDLVWDDLDRNGLQDAGEPGLQGVIVSLYDASGNYQRSDTTDAGGHYFFDSLCRGDYYLRFANLPQYYTFSPNEVGPDDNVDSDANPNGTTVIFTLASRERDSSWDAGIHIPPATLGNRVWNDLIPNGQQNAGEPGVPGVTVTLLDASGSQVSQTTTDANGEFWFTDLHPGTYSLAFSDLPAGWTFSPKNAASANDDSDVNPATGLTDPFFLAPGQTDQNRDAGIFLPEATLGDRVWCDDNRNGCQDPGEQGVAGIKVVLLDANGARVDSTVSSSSGQYQFSGIFPGTYQVAFTDLPAHYVFTAQDNCNDDATDSDVEPQTGLTPPISLWAGENEVNVDAGLMVPPASISGRVWEDFNQDGLQDPGEPGVANVMVFLYNQGNMPVNYTTTDAQGDYFFLSLTTSQSYYVVFSQLPQGYTFTSKDQGSDDGIDSDADSNGVTDLLYLAPAAALTLDAGVVAPTTMLQVAVLLEGAYEQQSGLMRDNLRSGSLLPSGEPYSGLGYNFVLGGGEQVLGTAFTATGADAIVDWVVVELRDASDPRQVRYSQAALLQRDGDIVQPDGSSALTVSKLPSGSYYLAVLHRNHLGVMTAQPVTISGSAVAVDFSDSQTQVYGNNSRKVLGNGTALLYGGDADGNGQVQNTDDVYHWMPHSGQAGYFGGDYNLDGQVQNTDHVYLWQENSGRGTAVPK